MFHFHNFYSEQRPQFLNHKAHIPIKSSRMKFSTELWRVFFSFFEFLKNLQPLEDEIFYEKIFF